MLDLTKPITTSDGRAVRIVETDLNKPDYSLVAIVTEKDGSEWVSLWTKSGAYYAEETSSLDLVNAPPPKRVGYVNIYLGRDEGLGMLDPYVYRSTAEADRVASPGRIACLKIEWATGQFDE
jgi:hypothetical protein